MRRECRCEARRGSTTAAPHRVMESPQARRRTSQKPWPAWRGTRPHRTRASGRRTGSAATCIHRIGTSRTGMPEIFSWRR
eukprot:1821016-Prymnesium_polylepis.1